jgi:hypothetical protein
LSKKFPVKYDRNDILNIPPVKLYLIPVNEHACDQMCKLYTLKTLKKINPVIFKQYLKWDHMFEFLDEANCKQISRIENDIYTLKQEYSKIYFKCQEKSDEIIYDNILKYIKEEDREDEDIKIKEDVNDKCAICMNNERTNVFVPCGHVCICDYCKDNIGNKCPLCRKSYTQIMKIYM